MANADEQLRHIQYTSGLDSPEYFVASGADKIYGNYENYVNSLRAKAKVGKPTEYRQMGEAGVEGNANSNAYSMAKALGESAQSSQNSVGGNGVGALGGRSAKQMKSGWNSTRKATDLKSVMSRVMKALK